MERSDACPACGHTGALSALIALGARHDHPHRWRRWVATTTHLYLCERCGALIEVRDLTHVP